MPHTMLTEREAADYQIPISQKKAAKARPPVPIALLLYSHVGGLAGLATAPQAARGSGDGQGHCSFGRSSFRPVRALSDAKYKFLPGATVP